MTPVPWIRLYVSFFTHRKTMKLRRELGTVEPVLRLWAWAAENAQDGRLDDIGHQDLEDAIGWRGKAGRAVSCMVAAGFLDDVDGTLSIHGWADKTGAGVEYLQRTRKTTAERQQRYRCSHGNASPNAKGDGQKSVGENGRIGDPLSSPGSSPPEADPEKSNECAKSAHDWLCYFNARYWQVRGKQRGCSSDAKATANLQDQLDKQGEVERAADWEARERIVDEFLARGDPRTVEAGHKFAFFVSSFDGLRVPPDQRPKSINGKPAPMQARY